MENMKLKMIADYRTNFFLQGYKTNSNTES
jgi:hypothetical protein